MERGRGSESGAESGEGIEMAGFLSSVSLFGLGFLGFSGSVCLMGLVCWGGGSGG